MAERNPLAHRVMHLQHLQNTSDWTDWNVTHERLKSFFNECLKKDSHFIKNIDADNFCDTFLQDADGSLKILRDELNLAEWSSVFKMEFLGDFLKCIRQAFGLISSLAKKLPQYENLLYNMKRLLNKLLLLDKQGDAIKKCSISLMKLSVQILGNACVYDCNRKLIWDLFVDVFCRLVEHPDNTLVDYTCMAVFQCLHMAIASTFPKAPYVNPSDIPNLYTYEAEQLILGCVRAAYWDVVTTPDWAGSWCDMVITILLCWDEFFRLFYEKLLAKEILHVFDITGREIDKLRQNPSITESPISWGNLVYLCAIFEKEVKHLLNLATMQEPSSWDVIAVDKDKTARDSDPSPYTKEEECIIVATQIIVILGRAAGQEASHGPRLRQRDHVLTQALDLLASINKLGKSGLNCFTPLSKIPNAQSLSSSRPQPTELPSVHPARGLRTDLVTLISNFVCNSKDNQDKVRMLDGIPLLLDQTQVDLHNPWMTQWVVLAVRHLCEDNPENRRVIACLNLQGLADHQNALRDAGIETEICDGKVVVRPVPPSVNNAPPRT